MIEVNYVGKPYGVSTPFSHHLSFPVGFQAVAFRDRISQNLEHQIACFASLVDEISIVSCHKVPTGYSSWLLVN